MSRPDAGPGSAGPLPSRAPALAGLHALPGPAPPDVLQPEIRLEPPRPRPARAGPAGRGCDTRPNPIGRRGALSSLALLGGLAATGGLAGCAPGMPRSLPMDLLHDDRACPATLAPALLVLLPGAHMPPAEMQREGLVTAVRQRGLAADVVIADAHMGYIQDRSVVHRLHADVVAPARRQGYRQVWLAGISLGGFVAMAYEMQRPGEVDGLLTLAPYLGRRQLVAEIAERGGPQAWLPGARPRDDDDADHALWTWLATRAAKGPPLYLGYGAQDRFAAGHAMMAGLLPPERVATVPGGHDWPPWRTLWAMWLDRGLLPPACST